MRAEARPGDGTARTGVNYCTAATFRAAAAALGDTRAMSLRYAWTLPDAAAFKALYDTTGWGPADRPAGFYAEALAGSWRACSVFDGEALIGFGRVISDGRLHAFITEMIVRPDHQQRGIGAVLLRELVAACHAAGISDIQLFCAEGRQAFYEKGGFLPRLPTRPGMQYAGPTSTPTSTPTLDRRPS